MSPCQPIKSSDLDKSRMKHGGLLNKHFCKKLSNIPNDLAEIVNFHFSHYKSMETLSCHSNQSSYPTKIKIITFVEGNILSKYDLDKSRMKHGGLLNKHFCKKNIKYPQ